ncbi:LppM family (lipo)protein [Rhodococcus sp. (in: high G+C Gram-positive bacteria)]|uniref:LppM family (lipo)protein n=1 Tax=Rhodococcus sp. TaxID=1831 RepID=UPI003B8A62F5
MIDVQPPSPVTSTPSRRRRTRARVLGTAALALLLVPLLAGCLRVQVSMGVSADDKVSGQIVAATVPKDDNDKGPQLTPPDSLADRMRVQEYDKDGYVGTQVFFSGLSFGEVRDLGSMSADTAGVLQLSLQRAGDLVSLDGRIDLEDVPAQGTDVQFTIAFPSRVATTNGTRDGDSTVTWKLPAGEVSTLRAEVRYADPSTRSFAGWAGMSAGVAVGVALIVGGMAWMQRNRAARARPRQDRSLETSTR